MRTLRSVGPYVLLSLAGCSTVVRGAASFDDASSTDAPVVEASVVDAGPPPDAPAPLDVPAPRDVSAPTDLPTPTDTSIAPDVVSAVDVASAVDVPVHPDAGVADPARCAHGCGAGEVCTMSGLGDSFCARMCTNGSAATETAQCGGGRTCLDNANGALGTGACTHPCDAAAASGSPGSCPRGQLCTGFWLMSMTGMPDAAGCVPWCSTDADCAGEPGRSFCNARTGSCGSTGDVGIGQADGTPCDPTTLAQCRGLCVGISATRMTQGICASFIDLAVRPNCPDPNFMAPLRRPGDNLGLCIYQSCVHNADCARGFVCRYQEDPSSGMVVPGSPLYCDYPTMAQPTGIP